MILYVGGNGFATEGKVMASHMIRVDKQVITELKKLKEHPDQSHNGVLRILLGIVPKNRAQRILKMIPKSERKALSKVLCA